MGLFVAAALLLGSHSALAAVWVGDTSQNWNDNANWDSDPNPPGGNFLINTSTGNFPILSANQANGPVDIMIADGGTTTGRFDHRAGGAGTGSGNWMFVGNGGSSVGTYNLSDTSGTGGAFTGFAQGSGSMDVGGFAQNGRLILGNGGTSTGTLNMNTSGTLTANQSVGNGGIGIIAGTNGGDGVINLDNGTINTTQAWFGDNNAGSSGTLNMSGGTVNPSNQLIFGRARGTGTLNMTGGTINAGNEVWFGEATSASLPATGTGTIGAGATLKSTNWFVIGRSGNAASSGSLTLNGGSIDVKTGGSGNLEIAVFDAIRGDLTINANSTVRLLNNAGTILGSQNTSGSGTVTQNGGSVTFYSDGGTTVGGTGALTIAGGSTSAVHTYHLNGGTLTVPSINKTTTNTNGQGIFNFNGGSLAPTATNLTFMQGLTRANVRDGGAVVDTNGFNITVGQALEHSNILGDNAADGGLTKNGSGTLTLTAANTYTGTTVLNSGTLLVNGSHTGGGLYTVNSGATLGGTGSTTAAVSALAGSTVSPGASIESLDVGSLTLGGALLVEYDGAASPAIDVLNVAAALDITAGTVSFSNLGAALTAPQYIFANYGSLVGGAFASVSGLPTGYAINYGTGSNSFISLVAIPEASSFLSMGAVTFLSLAIARLRRKL